MKKYLAPIITVVAVFVILGLIMIGPYNRLVGLEEEADKSLSNIDNQLQRRVELIPNLVDTVKGYTKHEEKVFKDVSDALFTSPFASAFSCGVFAPANLLLASETSLNTFSSCFV